MEGHEFCNIILQIIYLPIWCCPNSEHSSYTVSIFSEGVWLKGKTRLLTPTEKIETYDRFH